MKNKILALFAILLFPCPAEGKKQKEIDLSMRYEILYVDSMTERMRLVVRIPNNLEGRQVVRSQSFSVPPHSVYTVGSDRFAEFRLTRPIPEKIEIRSLLGISRNDYTSRPKGKKHRVPDPDDLDEYLVSEPFIDTDHPDIRNLARKLKGEDRLKTVKNIHSYLSRNIRWGEYRKKAQGSVQTLRSKEADCKDFSYLMVALCRANGIPARTVYGVVVTPNWNPRHQWVEVYFQNTGWTAVEPTPGNGGTFGIMANRYIYLYSGEKETQESYYYFYYSYRGSRPVVRSSYVIVEK